MEENENKIKESRKGYPIQLSKEQVHAILNEAEKRDDFDYMLFLTLTKTGRRLGELYGLQKKKEIGRKKVGDKNIRYKGKELTIERSIPIYKKLPVWMGGVKVSHIDFERGMMKVWVLKRRKHIQEESILTPEVLRVIKSYIKSNQLKLDDYLFRKRSYRQIENKIKYYAKKAGIKTKIMVDGIKFSLSCHSLRHYFITELIKKGRSKTEIIKLTGHKDEKTLAIYDHVLSSDFKEGMMDDIKDL